MAMTRRKISSEKRPLVKDETYHQHDERLYLLEALSSQESKGFRRLRNQIEA